VSFLDSFKLVLSDVFGLQEFSFLCNLSTAHFEYLTESLFVVILDGSTAVYHEPELLGRKAVGCVFEWLETHFREIDY